MSKGKYIFDNKKLKLGWMWETEDQQNFHIKSKGALYLQQSTGDIDWASLTTLMSVDKKWLEIRPSEKLPINYHIIRSVSDRYISVHTKFKPSMTDPIAYGKYLLMKPAIQKLRILFLTMYKEDTAYTTRFGGAIQYIYRHPQTFKQEDKLQGLLDMFEWWKVEDWRERTKPIISFMFTKSIQYYQENMFIRQSINFIIDELFRQQAVWNASDLLDPPAWWPRGQGSISYIIHGRKNA